MHNLVLALFYLFINTRLNLQHLPIEDSLVFLGEELPPETVIDIDEILHRPGVILLRTYNVLENSPLINNREVSPETSGTAEHEVLEATAIDTDELTDEDDESMSEVNQNLPDSTNFDDDEL